MPFSQRSTQITRLAFMREMWRAKREPIEPAAPVIRMRTLRVRLGRFAARDRADEVKLAKQRLPRIFDVRK